ncbi:MAG TPA: hypothetical protein PLI09_00070 [Candidatus Hydrogenedentes bacterium]|nr:hypothetical protein [Candidatus Hydrogenedentota bacterium]
MSLSEYPEIPLEEEVPAGPAKPARGLMAPIMLLLLGVLVLAMLGVVEDRWAAAQPWIDALVFPKDVIDIEGRAPVWARKVERVSVSPESDPLKAAVKTLLETEGLGEEVSLPEYVFAIETPVASFAPLLASGRLPEPGHPEVLAGDLADGNSILLDQVFFTVTGRLRGSVSGFIVDYVLPYHPDIAQFFSETAGATRGSFFVDGLSRVGDLLPPRKSEEDVTPPDFIGGQVRIPKPYAWTAWLGLILVAAGGITAYIRVFERLSLRPSVLFGPILRETVTRRRLFAAMHIIMFPTFFGAMAAGLCLPGLNYRLTEYMGFVFTQGDLSYIGDAYASGDILKATAATFINNYVVQTLGLTFAISFFPVPLGILKTLVSFGMVGFGMAPLWHGAAAGYAYHSITMVLELEAYVLACFAITVWPIRWARTFFSSSPGHEIFTNLRIFFGGAILAGVMLAIAALYEATTLILLGGF